MFLATVEWRLYGTVQLISLVTSSNWILNTTEKWLKNKLVFRLTFYWWSIFWLFRLVRVGINCCNLKKKRNFFSNKLTVRLTSKSCSYALLQISCFLNQTIQVSRTLNLNWNIWIVFHRIWIPLKNNNWISHGTITSGRRKKKYNESISHYHIPTYFLNCVV